MPEAPNPEAVRLVADLATGRQPRDGAWISTDGTVPEGGHVTIGTVFRGPVGEFIFADPFPAEAWQEWRGYSFSMYGMLTGESSGLGISQWRIYDTNTGATFCTVGILREQVRYGSSNLYVEALALPIEEDRQQVRTAILGWDLPHDDDDVARARHGLELLGLLAEIERKRQQHRRRLEDDPESGWLQLTEQALAMKQAHPHWQWTWIANKLNVHPSTLREYRRRRRLMNRA